MSIMVGYVPTPVGEAAVAAAITEAKLRGEELLIVNSVREGSRVDKSVASDEDLSRLQKSAADAGITARVLRPPTGMTSRTKSSSSRSNTTSR